MYYWPRDHNYINNCNVQNMAIYSSSILKTVLNVLFYKRKDK